MFAALSARSKATANGWLIGVSQFIVIDTVLYKPITILFFFVYLPSLIRFKLRALGDPTDRDINFSFETPMIEGAASYCAVRHKNLSMAPILLHRHAMKSVAREDGQRNSSLVARASISLWIWGAILILPETLQDLIVSELIILVVNVSSISILTLLPIFDAAWSSFKGWLTGDQAVYAWLTLTLITVILAAGAFYMWWLSRGFARGSWSLGIPDWVSKVPEGGSSSPTSNAASKSITSVLRDPRNESIWVASDEANSQLGHQKTSRNNKKRRRRGLPSEDEVGWRSSSAGSSPQPAAAAAPNTCQNAVAMVKPRDSRRHRKYSTAPVDREDVHDMVQPGINRKTEASSRLEVSPWGVVTKTPPTHLPTLAWDASKSMRKLQRILQEESEADGTCATSASPPGSPGGVLIPALVRRPPLPDIPRGKHSSATREAGEVKELSAIAGLEVDSVPDRAVKERTTSIDDQVPRYAGASRLGRLARPVRAHVVEELGQSAHSATVGSKPTLSPSLRAPPSTFARPPPIVTVDNMGEAGAVSMESEEQRENVISTLISKFLPEKPE